MKALPLPAGGGYSAPRQGSETSKRGMLQTCLSAGKASPWMLTSCLCTGSLQIKRITQVGVGRNLRGEGQGREDRKRVRGEGIGGWLWTFHSGRIVIFAYASPDTSHCPSSWSRAEELPETLNRVLAAVSLLPSFCFGRIMVGGVQESAF